MKNFSKIMGWNMAILFAYILAVYLTFSGQGGESALGILIINMFLVGGQVLINFIISMVKFGSKETEEGKSYLLATFLILVIGFASCWGSASGFKI